MLVPVQLLQIGGLWSGPRLGNSHHAACAKREFHSKERAKHGDRVVAPQSSVTPDNVFGHAHDPTRDSSVTGVFTLPLPPKFFSGRWMDLTGAVFPTAAEILFVTVVMFARVK